MTSPAEGGSASEGTPVDLIATATDPEDGDLSATIFWTSSVQGALGTGASVILEDPQIGAHFITARAIDHLGNLDMATLVLRVVANRPPSVVVTSPASLVEITPLDTLDLVATALDPEDGDLGPSAVWTSDRDGLLGSGDHITVTNLSVGLHGVTVSVTDGHGASGTAQTMVSVPEPHSLATLMTGAGLLALLSRRRERVSSEGDRTR